MSNSESSPSRNTPSNSDDRWLTVDEAANYLAIEPQTLAHYRYTGRGPNHHILPEGVRYLLSEIEAYIEEKQRYVRKPRGQRRASR